LLKIKSMNYYFHNRTFHKIPHTDLDKDEIEIIIVQTKCLGLKSWGFYIIILYICLWLYSSSMLTLFSLYSPIMQVFKVFKIFILCSYFKIIEIFCITLGVFYGNTRFYFFFEDSAFLLLYILWIILTYQNQNLSN